MIKVTRFKPEYQDAVVALITRIMTDEFGDALSAYPMDDVQNIAKSYGGLGEAFFVALSGTEVVGTVAIKKEDDRVAFLRRLFVSPDYRGQKMGSKLIDAALAFCKDVGYEEIIFKTTSRMTGAITVCQKSGFVQRARINLGVTELLKFSLSLAHGAGAAKK